MVRFYANVSTSIWSQGNDFLELTHEAQWAYMMLSTQSDISAAGILSLRINRWARRARNGTPRLILDALRELQEARKIAFDLDTEELLIRTFVKWDGGYGNPKRRPAIQRAAGEIESPQLREVLAGEFAKLGLPLDWLGLTEGADSLSAPYATGAVAADPRPGKAASPTANPESGKTTFPQVDSLSRRHTPSDGVVVTVRTKDPQPSNRKPQPPPPPALSATRDRANAASSEEEAKKIIEAAALAAHRARPDWDLDELRQALASPKLRQHPPEVVAEALALVAADPTSERPGRITAKHPYWGKAYQNCGLSRRPARATSSARHTPHAWSAGPDGNCTVCPLPKGNSVHDERPPGADPTMRSAATRRETQ